MNSRINWDALGISTSLACAIHCAVLPLVLQSLPIIGVDIIDNKGFEYFMIILAFLIGGISLYHGYRKHHHSFLPLMIFIPGALLLLAKQIWHDYQYWILPVAVLLIIVAHIKNYKACRFHNHAHTDDCNH